MSKWVLQRGGNYSWEPWDWMGSGRLEASKAGFEQRLKRHGTLRRLDLILKAME